MQTARPRNRVRVWLKRALQGLFLLAVGLSLAGAAIQVVGTAMDQRNFPAPGQLVDIGGFRLHLDCRGENTGGRATVVLEAGLGATSSVWAWIQPELARATRVCAYDRAGMGWSDPGPAPRDAEHIAGELHALLQNAGIPGPYVLAGWSFGGLYVRQYAEQYRDEVAGLVLLDSSSPVQCTATSAAQAQCDKIARILAVGPVLARLGAMRALSSFLPASGLPSPQSDALLASASATKDWDTQRAEFQAAPTRNDPSLIRQSLGALPLFALTATEHGTPPDLEQLWQGWQAGFAALSTNGVQQILPDSTHASVVMDATDAKASTAAIMAVVEAARTGRPLSPP